MLLTLGEARRSQDLADVMGLCGNSEQARNIINKATRMLMTRGNFWGTVQMVQGCILNQCVTWPRYVGSVLAVNTCGRSAGVWNNWAGFVPIGPAGVRGEGFTCNSDGSCGGNLRDDNYGTSPVFNQVPCGKEYYIRVYPASRVDIGKTITIYGIDFNGQVIRTKLSDGTWQDGVTLTIGVPFTSTSFKVREVTRVLKDVTQNIIRLFMYDADNDKLISMAAYDPSETSPDYRVSKIHGDVRACCCCPQGNRIIKALTKLQFIPAVNDTDLVLIENLDALGLMIQAIKNKNATNVSTSQALELDAVRELNLELRNRFPLNQTPVSINPFGTAIPARHGIGRII